MSMDALHAFATQHTHTVIAVWSLFLFWAGYRIGHMRGQNAEGDRMKPPRLPLDPPAISDEARANIEDALSRGNKIEAIRILREDTGLGLKESKEHVERMGRS